MVKVAYERLDPEQEDVDRRVGRVLHPTRRDESKEFEASAVLFKRADEGV